MNRSQKFKYPPQLERAPGTRRYGLGFYPVCWLLFLSSTPFYLFESGLPQPSDGLMALMVLILATGYIIRVPIYMTLYFCASLFVGYVAIVNWFWWIYYPDPKMLLSSVYYVYNMGVVVVVLGMLNDLRGRFVTLTQFGLALAVAVELVVCLFLPTEGLREFGSFNSPNQFSYWALVTLACWLVLKRDERLTGYDLAVFCAIGYLVVLGLSKAALLSFAALVLFGIVGQGMQTRRLRWSLGALVAIMAMVLSAESTLVEGLVSEGPIANVVDRIGGIGKQKDDSIGGRGYDRLWLYPEYLMIGAGEGAFERFSRSEAGRREIHSTFGTVLFSYGILGFVLFCLLLYQFFRNAPIRHLLYFIPICLYGLTHQGLRFSGFWIFLALVFGLANVKAVAKESFGSGRRARAVVFED